LKAYTDGNLDKINNDSDLDVVEFDRQHQQGPSPKRYKPASDCDHLTQTINHVMPSQAPYFGWTGQVFTRDCHHKKSSELSLLKLTLPHK